MKRLLMVLAFSLLAVPVFASGWQVSERNIIIGASFGSDYLAVRWYDKLSLYDSDGNLSWDYPISATDSSISENGKTLAAISGNEMVVFLDGFPSPNWRHSLGSPIGKVDVTGDGSRIAVAVNEEILGVYGIIGYVTVLDSQGTVMWTSRFSNLVGGPVNSVKITDDGDRVLLQTPKAVYIYDRNGLLAAIPAYNCCIEIQSDISSDGNVVAVGSLNFQGYVSVYEFSGTGYVPKWTAFTGRNSVRNLALSGDGSTLVVGANNVNSNGGILSFDDGLVIAYDTASGVQKWEYSRYGYQGKISQVDISFDGSRVVAGAYGSFESDKAVLTVFDGSAPVREIMQEEFGSVTHAGMSKGGDKVFAAGSTSHPFSSVSDGKLIGFSI